MDFWGSVQTKDHRQFSKRAFYSAVSIIIIIIIALLVCTCYSEYESKGKLHP